MSDKIRICANFLRSHTFSFWGENMQIGKIKILTKK